MSKFSSETFVKVWDDKSGSCVEIGPDADLGELCEVSYRSETGVKGDSVVMDPEQAVMVAQAILKLFGPKDE